MRTPRHRSPKSLVAPLRLSFVAVVAVLLLAAFTSDQAKGAAYLNKDRRARGLSTLPEHPAATARAQAWAVRLAGRTDAAGQPQLTHSRYAEGWGRVRWCSVGENVGFVPTTAGFSGMQRAYMASPPHRTNILSPKWNRVGVGVAYTADRRYLVTVQLFLKTC